MTNLHVGTSQFGHRHEKNRPSMHQQKSPF
jgi:hypothetical protein